MDTLRPTTTYGQDSNHPFFVWSDKRGAAVAQVFVNTAIPPFENDPEQVELTRLFAAAPELLDALIVLLDHAQEKYPHFESERGQADIARALSAIAKAKGE